MFRALFLTCCLLFSMSIGVPARQTSSQTASIMPASSRGADGEKGPAPTSVKVKPTRKDGAIPPDVIIGSPQPIPYSRAFPLLDGLFQDVSAIQLTQLSLTANQSNASNLDALIQQFQASIQYSQTLGLQNAAAAQQSAAYSASGSFQTQLINQASQLITLQLNAQQQVGQAQMALNSLPATATTDQKDAARQALTLANDSLNAINAQIANVKAQLATSIPAPTYSAPSPTPTAFPSPPVTLRMPVKDDFSPTFPASKQMENQVNLLWERLANLVNTLAQTDNPNGISLVKFHTGITSGKNQRKNKLLSTQYSLTCTGGDAAPQVLDLFPRNAAVNISNMKYRDSRFGLSALLSFFSVGANAAYNREHLRITQTLGQSAYITGFGLETSSFGWVFSPSLGEEVVAPGDRTTFALIAAPEGCKEVRVHLVQAAWDKSPLTSQDAWDETKAAAQQPAIKNLQEWSAEPRAPLKCDKCIQRIAYTPVEFEGATPGVVTVSLNLKDVALDREQTVSVNGIIVKRARDTFGRATTAGGSGGLLQAAALDAGTWIPVSSKELILNLNPSLFTRRFPSILLNSPNGSIDVNSQMSDKTEVNVAGVRYTCPTDPNTSCASFLPAIGRHRATPKQFAIARLMGKTKRIVVTLPDATVSTSGSAAAGALPPLQVISDGRKQVWSANAKVLAFQEQGRKNLPLQCEPAGERLICEMGDLDLSQRTEFDVYDSDFKGGTAVKGPGVLKGCVGAQCVDPLIWDWRAPRWDPSQSAWIFRVWLVNVKSGQTVKLGQGGAFEVSNIQCPGDEGEPCEIRIKLPKDKFHLVWNTMPLQVFEADAPVGKPEDISNLRYAISPVLSEISADYTRFSGQNLVFDEIQIGAKKLKLKCLDGLGLDCYLPGPGFAANDEGYLYFVGEARLIPLMLINDKGLQVVPPRKPKQAPAGGAAAGTTTNPNPPVPASQTPSQQIQQNPETRIYSTKEQ